MIAIDWKPSRQAALPLYRQIYLFIQSKIQSNQWTQGTILPPQRELANKLDVNRSTLTIAIEELIADGYLTSRQGSGIKVSGSAWAEITAGSRSWNDRLSADAFLSNQPLIQKINELEFAPGMIRLGTGELAPELFPRSALQRLIAETAPEIDNFGYQEPPPPLKALDSHGMVLYVSSLSKTIGPGLRIGWITGPEPIIRRLADLKMQHDYGSSILSQWIAAEWLRRGLETTHLQLLRESLRLRRSITRQCLEKYFPQLASWNIPAGGFYIWLKLKQPISMPALFKAACARNLLLNPGTIYDQRANQFLRISYAYAKPDELKYGLQQLAELLQSV